jgi:hypothetical protein
MDVLQKFKNESCGDIKNIEYHSSDFLPEDTVYNKIVKLSVKNEVSLNKLARRFRVKYLTIYKNNSSYV